MDIRIAVVAHTKRLHQARRLTQAVGAGHVSADDGSIGAYANHRRAWEWLADNHNGAPFCLALEDDAVPVAGFGEQLGQALAVAPAPVVSLYLGQGRPPHWQDRIKHAIAQADQQHAHWLVTHGLLHGVAIAIRTELVPDMLGAIDAERLPIDYAIRNWACRHGHAIAFTLPSLCDHHDGPSLIRHPDGEPRTTPRRAWRTGTRDTWTDKAVSL